MSCGVGCRRSLHPVLLWLWRRPASTALVRPLAWEHLYAAGAALEKAKRQKTKTKNKKQNYHLQTNKTKLEFCLQRFEISISEKGTKNLCFKKPHR